MKFEKDLDKVSYSLGLTLAGNLNSTGIKEINIEAFCEGISSVYNKQQPEISLEEAGKIVQEYLQGVAAEQAKEIIEEGNNFLAENAQKEGVVTLPSGLQYKVLTEGNGKKPLATDKVKCHYHGTLINGDVFDSSVERNDPATFPVNGVIQGWVEALQLMNEGSKWELYIPSNLAYGERGAGPKIGPHTTLIFQVELLEVL
ncbi:MAG: FKBP-type peptidyl-prolyl cis-trans isomerase [Bacteroidales bacterium]|nr:FKBP-type peptidyl-prolyl cis-trans isomerase [Bacteroidales bacterium]